MHALNPHVLQIPEDSHMPDEHARGAVYDVRGSTWTSTITCSQSLHLLFAAVLTKSGFQLKFALGTGVYRAGLVISNCRSRSYMSMLADSHLVFHTKESRHSANGPIMVYSCKEFDPITMTCTLRPCGMTTRPSQS